MILLTLAATPAAAETAPAGDARAEARAHAEQARRLFDVGDFEEALAEYTAAYEIAPAAGVLFNMGQCHRQLGNHERAVFFFEGYLRRSPEATNRAVVEELLALSRQELEEEQRTEAERVAEEERRAEELLRAEAEGRAEAARQAEADRLAAEAAAAERPPPPTPVWRTWWLWTIVGVVVAAGVTTGVVVGTWEQHPVLPGGSLGTIDGR